MSSSVSKRSSQRLWAALYLGAFPLEVLTRGAAGHAPEALTPMAVTDGAGSAPRVLACNDAARRAGIEPGMRVAAALATLATLELRVRRPALEAAAIGALAAWCGQFTSMVCSADAGRAGDLGAERAGLLLEIGGSLELFGGLVAIQTRLLEGLAELGYTAALAIAPTPLAAWWLARAGDGAVVLDRHRLRQHVAALDVHDLDLEPGVAGALTGIGVRSVEACLALPRAESARRFGPALWHGLDRALGIVDDPRRPLRMPKRLRHRVLLPAPVSGVEGLLFALGRMLREALGTLCASGRAIQALEVEFEASGGGVTRMPLALIAPSRDRQHLLTLLRHRLERLQLHDTVEQVVLAVTQSVALAPRNLDLFDAPGTGEDWLAILERLHARLGEGAVRGVRLCDDHRPERAWRTVTPGQSVALTPAASAPYRPLWLLQEPRLLTMRDGVLVYRGPLGLESPAERIEGGWWEDAGMSRDYHVAVNGAGERYWIYRDRRCRGAWFLHGVFA